MFDKELMQYLFSILAFVAMISLLFPLLIKYVRWALDLGCS